MNDLFDQERPLTLSVVKLATGVLGIMIVLTGLMIAITSLGIMFDGQVVRGLMMLVGSFTGLFFLFLLIRLLGENLAAMYRLSDRLTVLGDDIRSARAISSEVPPATKPRRKTQPKADA